MNFQGIEGAIGSSEEPLHFKMNYLQEKMIALRSPLGDIASHFCLLKTVILIELVMELSIQTSPLNYHFFNLLY